MIRDKDVYAENKDSIDLLINICNFVADEEIIKKQDNDRWDNLFNIFKHYAERTNY